MNKNLTTIGMVLALAVAAHAQQPATADREQAQRIVAEIKVDKPLQDPSICRGPDGTHYLTGTVATRQKADGTPNFHENDGAYLWKSADLKSWSPLGCVFDLKTQPPNGWGVYRWLRHPQPVPDEYREERVFGVVAPEIHCGAGTFWLTLSMSRQGTGLLRSTSGKAEGPYELVDVITAELGDPSLYFNGDEMWWVFEAGFVGKLVETKPRPYTPEKRKSTLALESQPALMQPAPETNGFPLRIGERGAFLAAVNGRFHLLATEEQRRKDGTVVWDTFVASADKPGGPYGKRRLLIPGGGQATLFQNDKGEWLAACAKDGDLDKLVIVKWSYGRLR